MTGDPQVGDVWIGEDDDGRPIFRIVTIVEPPITDPSDPRYPCDWKVALDGGSLAHLGWWHGQGWSKLESDEAPATWVLATGRMTEEVYQNASRVYFPDPGYPTHVVIWTGETITVVPYRSIEYFYKRD